MGLLTQIGAGAPSGTGATVSPVLSGWGVGDFLSVFVAAAVGGTGKTWNFTDPLGMTWTGIQLAGNSNESGAIYWTIATQASSGETVSSTISSGTPGGRIYLAHKVTAAMLAAAPFDQSPTAVSDPSSTPSVTSAALAGTNGSLCIGYDLQRASAGTAVFTWGGGWTSDSSQVGGGTPASGIFVAEQSVANQNPVTASGTSGDTGADHHEMAMIVLELPAAASGGSPAGTVRVRVGGHRLVDVGLVAA